MFGYVKPVVGNLLVKEHEFYRATYCGICRAMKKHTGFFSNLTLTYDSVFLALVRMAYIDDSCLGSKLRRCAAHPIKRRVMLNDNPAIEYTARAFAVLAYYKMRDDIADEGIWRKALVNLSRPVISHGRKRADMKELGELVGRKLSELDAIERAAVDSADEPAEKFGEVLGEIFAAGHEGANRTVLYQCGLHLGRFILCADAAEDYERDRLSGSYNPYVLMYGGAPLSDENRGSIKRALLWEIGQIMGAVNLIPFGNKITVENIVRNIVSEGLEKRIEFLDNPKEKRETEDISK